MRALERGLVVLVIFFAINLIYSSMVINIFSYPEVNMIYFYSTMSLAFIFTSVVVFMLKIELCKRSVKLKKEDLSEKEINKKFKKMWLLAALMGTLAVFIASIICIAGVPEGNQDIISYKFGSILWGLLGVTLADHFIEQHYSD